MYNVKVPYVVINLYCVSKDQVFDLENLVFSCKHATLSGFLSGHMLFLLGLNSKC